jgi:hypothetical protein
LSFTSCLWGGWSHLMRSNSFTSDASRPEFTLLVAGCRGGEQL